MLKTAGQIYWRDKHLKFMDNELEFLRTLRHPHVIEYVHHIRDNPGELQIFTELCEYGDLETRTDK